MLRKNGFTLIELLVVIAIIAILAAILFPMMLRAKQSSKNAVDLDCQRQLGLALVMYADQHDGKFPRTTRAGTLRQFPAYPSATNTTISGELITMLKSYAKNRRIFYCSHVDAYVPPLGKMYSYEVQSEANPPFMYIGYYYYAGEGWAGPDPVTLNGNSKRIIISCIGGGVGGNGEGRTGHGYAQGIYTFADGHSKFIHHFNYPYSYSECRVPPLTIKDLLLPKWQR